MNTNLPNKKRNLSKQDFKKSINANMPMSVRLFLFLVVLVLTIILGVIAILMITGTFTAGLSENKTIVENELLHASDKVSKAYGQLSIQAIEFSKALSKSMEEKMDELGISSFNLKEHPELLEEIISKEYERAFFSLQLSKSSGVFFILDATINPTLDNAKNSRAGLYLKNMEPNILSSSTPNIIVLRGFPNISRNNSLSLHAQWNMEFDISNAAYYHRPMVAANLNAKLPLSRLYYWSNVVTLPGTSEEVMLCSVPLIDSNGNVFGVCGFEVSSMLFKLSYMPNKSIYNRMFCLLSPINESIIDFSHSMYAGSTSARVISKGNSTLRPIKNRHYLYSYKCDQNNLFLGIHTPIHLYPKDSIFSNEQWIVAIMIPEEDVVDSVVQLNLLLFSLLILLFILGIIASLVLSKKFLKLISKGIDIIKSKDLSKAPKTQIPEIDDLIDFLKSHNEDLYKKAKKENLSFSILDEFLENTKKLSPAESSVFELYVDGHNAKEIADRLYLSINTIKTHSKHIYTKLNVSSREELLLYVNLLKEIGNFSYIEKSD